MRCFECGSTEHLAGACPRRNLPAAGATTFFANRAIQPSSSISAGPLAGIIDHIGDNKSPGLPAHTVTFWTHADIAAPVYQSFHTYMVAPHEGTPDPDTNRSDPLTQNDPWSASASQSWSLPTSAPQSFAPPAPQPDISRYAASGCFRAPCNVLCFGRAAVSEPAVANTSEQPLSRVSAEPVPSAEPPSSHPPVQVTQEPAHVPNMQWASMAHMPQELRDLMPSLCCLCCPTPQQFQHLQKDPSLDSSMSESRQAFQRRQTWQLHRHRRWKVQ